MFESTRTRSKAAVRHVLDRAVAPYVDQIRTAPAPAEPAAPPVAADAAAGEGQGAAESESGAPSDFFHGALHELRTIELGLIPKGARSALSVGASGRWYFDWFEAHVGELEAHYGVEAFEEMPDDLPDYVVWIPSTADKFDQVADGSVDLVFAGQTTEHLWERELEGFLVESSRVLSDGGLLVLDSPNRLVTDHLVWSHGQHTIELSASEMVELLELAGFDAERVRGAWRCRFGDTIMPLEDGLTNPALLVRRIAEGADRPDDSFIWWIDARKTDRAVDHAGLRARIEELFAENFETRISRAMWDGPEPGALSVAAGESGVLVSSLPIPLRTGPWTATVALEEGTLDSLDGLRVVISWPGGHVVHSLDRADGQVEGESISWEFDQPELMFALTLDVVADEVREPVRLRMPLGLSPR